MKRTIDLVSSVLGLIILSPLLLVIAITIKLDSPGSAFFRQTRVGWRERPFDIFKFRTMRAGTEAAGGQLTVRGDPRVTRIGRFLRHYKIDELPQLLNVMRGEMSLVGPRPEVPTYVRYYPESARAAVFSVRPGITDPAAIVFVKESEELDGAGDPHDVYVREILPRKLEYYVAYAQHHDLFGDIKIIARTFAALLH